jgi:hypothetical protein
MSLRTKLRQLTYLTDVSGNQAEKVSQGDTGPKQWHNCVDTVWRILIVFDERPRIPSVMDVVVEIGWERLKGPRNVLYELLHGWHTIWTNFGLSRYFEALRILERVLRATTTHIAYILLSRNARSIESGRITAPKSFASAVSCIRRFGG